MFLRWNLWPWQRGPAARQPRPDPWRLYRPHKQPVRPRTWRPGTAILKRPQILVAGQLTKLPLSAYWQEKKLPQVAGLLAAERPNKRFPTSWWRQCLQTAEEQLIDRNKTLSRKSSEKCVEMKFLSTLTLVSLWTAHSEQATATRADIDEAIEAIQPTRGARSSVTW